MTVLENEESLIKIGDALIRVYGFDNSTYGNERYDAQREVKPTDWTVFLAHDCQGPLASELLSGNHGICVQPKVAVDKEPSSLPKCNFEGFLL